MTRFPAIVETYLSDLRRIRASGGATGERSGYGPLANLLNEIGGGLRPKVFCVGELADQGAGHPDFGLYAAKQVQRGGQPKDDQLPEHGVVEVKSAEEDAWLTAESAQVSSYLGRYRLVLVTNFRDFVLVDQDASGKSSRLERFQLAADAEDFDRQLEKPRAFAGRIGVGLGEYLRRVLSHRARLAEPRDLAELLASHARDALARVEAAESESGASAGPLETLALPGGGCPEDPHPNPLPRGEGARAAAARGTTGVVRRSPLATVRTALEEALGVQFKGERGARFFRSTLVQTLFYGVFSAWVLWARLTPPPRGEFDWKTSVWHLRAPVLRALFQQLSDPGRLQPLGLVEVLDWTAAALNRVERAAFFARFNEGEAVTYFYEPFLQAFDPALRKQLGVWYTPPEVVRYMVARVDKALKDDLGIAEGLAADNVYVLDPCCGTGAYLAETLRRIAENLEGQGLGALTGARVKQAATERVFGFEIMPAPFVVAHLQVGLTMQDLDAPLADDGAERAGIFLTNALTGWEPQKQKLLAIPELAEERDRAEEVKQKKPILVILGNPPYNGFAGMAVDEERDLSDAYRTTRRVRRPEGQGLNDLYVRFFRMAERRIAEKTGQGVVCFISNYSWLDSLSCPGMRERYLEAFDRVRIDNLHGDRIISEYAPDGRTSETVFAIQGQSPGIKIGTAIALLSKSGNATSPKHRHIWYRDFDQARAEERRLALLESLDAVDIDGGYSKLEPESQLGLPFKPMAVSPDWFDWLALPDLFPTSFPGVKTSRDAFLVDIDIDRLRERVAEYFDPDVSNDEITRLNPIAMRSTQLFNARAKRESLLRRGGPTKGGFRRYAYRPFDTRWIYWEAESGLLDRPRPEYQPHVFEGNLSLVTQQKPRREWSPPQVISYIGCIDLMDRSATCVPAWLSEDTIGRDASNARRPNLSPAARRYLDSLGWTVEDLIHHVVAVLHDPDYREANAGALRMEWPRISLPHWSELSGRSGTGETDVAAKIDEASETLADSVARGRELAALLDPEMPVSGVTTGQLRPEIAAIAVPATTHGLNMFGDDFGLTAGWGHFGSGQAVMPGQGRAVERAYTGSERSALGTALDTLGDTTYDIHLNDNAYWRNVPANVWNYRLGGYQVLKKWLSYRERKVLGRELKVEEVGYFSEVARRVGAILSVTSGE